VKEIVMQINSDDAREALATVDLVERNVAELHIRGHAVANTVSTGWTGMLLLLTSWVSAQSFTDPNPWLAFVSVIISLSILAVPWLIIGKRYRMPFLRKNVLFWTIILCGAGLGFYLSRITGFGLSNPSPIQSTLLVYFGTAGMAFAFCIWHGKWLGLVAIAQIVIVTVIGNDIGDTMNQILWIGALGTIQFIAGLYLMATDDANDRL
jgi:drug/metabolite transporter (DMT)-like permease